MIEVGSADAMPQGSDKNIAMVHYGLAVGGVPEGKFQRLLCLGVRRDSKGLDRRSGPVVQIDSVLDGQRFALGFERVRVVLALGLAGFQTDGAGVLGIGDAAFGFDALDVLAAFGESLDLFAV